jgi:hypothetical protein
VQLRVEKVKAKGDRELSWGLEVLLFLPKPQKTIWVN